ncbi:hypothetical protein KQI52_10195 [bacterium]|nr:hypothetical protein [bacterium]
METRVVPIARDRIDELVQFFIETDEVIPDRAAEVWPERVKLWWERNPFMPSDWTCGWALENEDGEIVGFFGQIPVPFQVHGKPRITHWTTAFRVRKPYRGQGEDLRRAALEDAKGSIIFANSTIDRLLYRVKRYYMLVPRWELNYDVRRVSLAVGNGASVLRRIGVPQPFPKLAGRLVEILQRIWLTPLHRPSTYAVRRIKRVDDQFQELWSRTRVRYENTQLRTAEYLRWMMSGPPQKPRVLLGCYDPGGTLVGYLLAMPKEPTGGITLLVIDLWVDEPRQEITRALVAGVIDFARVYEYGLVDLFHFTDEIGGWCKRWRLPSQAKPPRKDHYRVDDYDSCNFRHSNSYFTYEGDYVL